MCKFIYFNPQRSQFQGVLDMVAVEKQMEALFQPPSPHIRASGFSITVPDISWDGKFGFCVYVMSVSLCIFVFVCVFLCVCMCVLVCVFLLRVRDIVHVHVRAHILCVRIRVNVCSKVYYYGVA